MANNLVPGPMCQVLKNPKVLADGTMCLCETPLPGITGSDLSMWEHLAWSNAGSDYLAEERWFESRYPNMLESARAHFVKAVNDWVESHWGDLQYIETSPRINIYSRTTFEIERKVPIVWTETKVRDDHFKECGDLPQSYHESDKVLGSFAIDIDTPIPIVYYESGVMVNAFRWTTSMYVEDILGVQAHDKKVAWIPGIKDIVPSRKVKRAKWLISGEGSHLTSQQAWSTP
jgi:hypothetical protein